MDVCHTSHDMLNTTRFTIFISCHIVFIYQRLKCKSWKLNGAFFGHRKFKITSRSALEHAGQESTVVVLWDRLEFEDHAFRYPQSAVNVGHKVDRCPSVLCEKLGEKEPKKRSE